MQEIAARLGGESRLLPRIESTHERVDLVEAELGQPQRRTGAGCFVGSGAIRHDGTAARQRCRVLVHLILQDADRAGQLLIGARPRRRRA
jgi:hypothetical protein